MVNVQPSDYRAAALPPEVPMLAIEAGTPLGWQPCVGAGLAVIGVNRIGASAPGNVRMCG